LISFLSSFVYGQPTQAGPKVLIYSATQGFRHDSIPTAIQSMKDHTNLTSFGIQFDNTEDATKFTDENLSQYDALLFLMTTGEVLDPTGITSLQNYLNRGGNFVAIHAASDCLRNTSFYGNEVGAYFDYHPELQNGTVLVVDSDHPSTSKLPQRWNLQDEFYNFDSDPRSVGGVVVLSVDASTYTDTGHPKDQGSPHPIAWFQDHGAGASSPSVAGRSFYSSLGHLNQTWETDLYIGHVMGGISWALQSNTTKAFNSSALVGNSGSTNSNPSGTVTNPSGATGSPSPSSTGSANRNVSGTVTTLLGGLLAFLISLILGV